MFGGVEMWGNFCAGRGKKNNKLDKILGEDPFESSWAEQVSLINKAIFQAPAPSYSKSVHPWSPADCVYLDSMSGYHFPAVMVRCKRAPATRAILHCHANACDVGHIYELCQRDAECWQANVLLVEYPGYGTSPGVSYERSVDRHVMCAYEYLVSDLGYKPENIVLFGRSLGSGPVCRLAARLQDEGERVGGVILHSPFISVREVGISLLGHVANIISDRWDNRTPLRIVKSKVLIIHGASDEVVPFRHAEVLRDVRKTHGLPCTFFPTQGTHNYFSYYRDYLQPVENFLGGLENRNAASTPKPLPPLPDPLPHAKYSRAQVREMTDRRRRIAAQEHERATRSSEATSLVRDVAGLMRGDDDEREHEGRLTSLDEAVRPSRRSPNSTLESTQALDGAGAGVNGGAGYSSEENAPVKWSKKSGDGVGARRTKGAMAGAIGLMDGAARGPNYVPGGASPVAFMSPGRPTITPMSPTRRSTRSLG